MASATAQVNRFSKVRFSLSGKINELNLTLRKTRVAAYEEASYERDVNYESLCEEIRHLETQRNDLAKAMSYVVSFSLARAEVAQAEANFAEREATARLLSAQALQRRFATLDAAKALKKIDDGISISFRDATSQRLLEQASAAQREADNYKAIVSKAKADMATEQDLVSPNLFNG